MTADVSGGIINASDEGVIFDQGDDSREQVGCFREVNRYEEATDERFVRCPKCGGKTFEDVSPSGLSVHVTPQNFHCHSLCS